MGQARDLAERWWTAFEGNRLEDTKAFVSPDAVITMPGSEPMDRETFHTQVAPMYLAAFPGLTHKVVDVIEQGDTAVIRLHTTMTHTGTMVTPQGEVPATGRVVELESCDVVTVADGLIVSWHTYFDQMSFMGQLGLLS